MFKLVLLLKRGPGVDADSFSDRWIDSFARLHPHPRGPARHVHNRVLTPDIPIENAPPAPFDAVDEYWFDSAADADSFFGSPLHAPARSLQGLLATASALAGTPRLLWQKEDARDADPVKIVVLPVRRPGMGFDAFVDYWTVTHAGLALGGPTARDRLRRLEACPAEAPLPAGFARAACDGCGSIQFGSIGDLQAEFGSSYYRTVLAPDEPRFTDPTRSCGLMVREIDVHSRAGQG